MGVYSFCTACVCVYLSVSVSVNGNLSYTCPNLGNTRDVLPFAGCLGDLKQIDSVERAECTVIGLLLW